MYAENRTKNNRGIMSNNENSKPRLLVTEDDVENQKLLQLILNKKFEVDICDSAQSFFERLSEKEYDAVLMDVTLKNGANGVDIVKDLRKKSQFKYLPVVCLSANVFGQDRKLARDAGIDVYLTKPVDSSLLINTLNDLIEQKLTQQNYIKFRLLKILVLLK
jgi:DNA-binding response OmpR family regulator